MNLKLRVNWGTGIALAYGLFVAGTTAFVIFALGRPVELVSADYYEQSLTYDQRLDAVRRGDALGDAVRVAQAPDGRALIVTLPRELASVSTGTLTLYRPSSEAADRVVPLALDAEGDQRVPLAGVAPGHWIVKIEWQSQGRRYYRQAAVQVQR